MADKELKISIIIDALNKTEASFNQLKTQIEAVQAGTQKTEVQTKKLESTVGSAVATMKAHWLALSVAIVGAGFAVSKAWDFVTSAAKFEEQFAALDNLALKHGTTAKKITENLQAIAKAQISLRDATAIAAEGLLKGLSPEQLGGLINIARRITDITGTSIPEAMQRMVQAMISGRDIQLKLLGINVDLGDAFKKYGEELTATERLQIAVNAVLADGDRIMRELGADVDSNADKIERLNVAWENFKHTLREVALTLFVSINEALDKMAAPIDRLIDKFREAEKAPAGLTEEVKKLREESDKSFQAYMRAGNQAQSTFTILTVSVRDVGDVGSRAFDKIKDRIDAINLKQFNAQMDKLAKGFSQFQEETTTLQTFDPNAAGSLPEYLKISGEKMEEVKKKFGSGFNEMNEFAIQAARNMQTAFSDLFFNVMTGKLDSFREVLHGFFSSMLRAISEIMAKMLLTKLIGASLGMGGGGGGGLLGGLLGFAGGGIVPGGIRLVPRFQAGGLITSPTLGVVGEGGQPEIVSPVDKFFNFLERRDTGDRAKSVTVNQIFNISPGVPEAVRREVMAMRPLLKKDAIEAVQEARNRGGSMARSMGSKA